MMGVNRCWDLLPWDFYAFADRDATRTKKIRTRNRILRRHDREHIGVANDWERLRKYLLRLFVDFPDWHVRARIASKSVPIGHFHARKRLFVQLRLSVDNSV